MLPSIPITTQWRHRVIEYLWYAFGLTVTLVLGMSNLFYPFGVDQAVFLLGAKALDQGAILYVDYWDNKQPGLYYFWMLAGRLFGFDEFGIHMLELLCLLAFSMVLIATLRTLLQQPWLAALAPVATVGVYYATVNEYQLTQLEMIVGVPIYLLAWWAYKGVQRPSKITRYFFLAGLCAGVVAIFKLALSAITLAVLVVATVYALSRTKNNRLRLLTRCSISAGLGVFIPVGLMLMTFWHWNALDELLWTALTYSQAVFDSAPAASKTRLITAGAFYLSYFAPWLLFAGIAAWSWWRDRSEVLLILLLTWLIAALLIIGLQRFSWWQYHTLLLFAPTGILAVLGVDRVVAYVSGQGGRTGIPAMTTSVVIGLPLVASLAGPLLKKAQPLLSETLVKKHGLQTYHWETSRYYKPLWKGTRFLTEPDALPGPIYSFGHAMVYQFSDRTCAHKIAGSSWEFYLPEQIQDILDTLKRDAVPYVFVDRREAKITWLRPEIWSFLQAHYEVHQEDDSGIWFRWRAQELSGENR